MRHRIDRRLTNRHGQPRFCHPPDSRTTENGQRFTILLQSYLFNNSDNFSAIGHIRIIARILDNRYRDLTVLTDTGMKRKTMPITPGKGNLHRLNQPLPQQDQGSRLGRCRRTGTGGKTGPQSFFLFRRHYVPSGEAKQGVDRSHGHRGAALATQGRNEGIGLSRKNLF